GIPSPCRARPLLLALALVPGGMAAPAPAFAQQAADESIVSFWDRVGDPVLERLVGEAVRSDRNPGAADAGSQAARAERTGAALELTPSLTAVGGYSRQQLSGASMPGIGGSLPRQDLWDAGLQLAWDVDVFGRQRRILKGRSAQVASADASLEDTRYLVAAAVAHAYFELRGQE